jgi:trk system potassium uptake protein TrkH
MDKKIIQQATMFNVLIFIVLYFLIICMSALIISFMGFDLMGSFSTAASLLGNVGPHLGSSGLSTDFSSMPEAGKLFLSALMITGRLELLTVIVLFTRSFYRH